MKSAEKTAPPCDSFSKLLHAFSGLRGSVPAPTRPETVLFWRSPSGVLPSLTIEMVVALGLRRRGLRPVFSICGGLLSGCLMREMHRDRDMDRWGRECAPCAEQARALLRAAGLEHVEAGGTVSQETAARLDELAQALPLADIPGRSAHGVKTGEFAVSSLARYLGGVTMDPASPLYERLLRAFFSSSLRNTEAAAATLDRLRPDRVVMQDGIYVDWGPMFNLCLTRGIPVTRWERGYVLDHLIMRTCVNENRHIYSLRDATWAELAGRGLGEREDRLLDEYFAQRKSGVRSLHLLFTEKPLDREAFLDRYGLDRDKPVWCVFPHVGWDAAFALQDLVFEDQTEWLTATLEIIRHVPEVTWLIKVHPSEHKLDTLYGVRELVRDRFPDLPGHIRVIPSDDGINTYGMLPHIHGGITCMGTVGLELAAHGKPVILSERAHYGGKGFTRDSASREEYARTLREAGGIPALTPEETALARIYAHAYFVSRQLPFRFIHHFDNLTFTSLEELDPGRDRAMDLICGSILDGGEFLLNPEPELTPEGSR